MDNGPYTGVGSENLTFSTSYLKTCEDMWRHSMKILDRRSNDWTDDFFFRFQKMGQQEMIISAVCWRLATYVVVWYDCVVFYWPPTNTYSRLIIKPRSYKNRCPRRGVGCSRWNTIVCWLPRSESTWQSIPMAEHSWTKFERRPRALWAFYTRCYHSSWSSCYVGPKSLRTKVSTKKYILDVRIRILRCAAPIHVKGVI